LHAISLLRAGNMVLFDQRGVIKRYETAEDILKEFYELRIDYYGKRRLCLIKVPTSPSCLCLTVASH
jgi:hypothetical protein